MENTNTSDALTENALHDEMDILDLLQIIANNLRLLVLGPLIAGVCALGFTYLIPPKFTATVRVMPPTQQSQGAAAAMLQSLGTLGAVTGASAGLKNPGDLYVGLLKTRSVQDAMLDRFNLLERYDSEYRDLARKVLINNTTITSGKDGIISIDVDDIDPVFVEKMANGYAQELGNVLSRLSISEAQLRSGFFEKQLAKTKLSLEKAEIALKASGGVSIASLKLNPGFAVGTTAQIKGQMTSLEIRLVSMRGYMSETSPEYKQVATELAALRGYLAKAEQNETTPKDIDSEYLDKYRDFKYLETLYELLIRQYDSAKLDESREGNVMQIVDTAVVPERKSKPKRALIAVLVTICFGILLLFFFFMQNLWINAMKNQATTTKVAKLSETIKQVFKKK